MNEKMTFAQCARKAKDMNGHDSARFEVVGPGGRMGARWLDAYFGLFMLDGEEGFQRDRDAEAHGLWCENLQASAPIQPTREE